MNALNRLSIRTRLYFGTVFSLVLLVVIGAMGYLALERTRNTLEVLFTQRVQTLTDMGELRTTLGDLRRAEKDIIINFNNTIEVSNGRDLWKKSLQNLNKGMADVRKVQAGDASFAEAIDKALAEVKEYEAGISPVFEQIERAQIDGAVGGAYAEKYKKHMEASDKLLFDLAMDARKKMDEARQGVDALASTMSGMIGVALLLALAVLIPLTFFSVRSITQSISQASELAERIAGGDLSRDVQVTSSDEVGQLVGAMSRMQDALRGLVHQVQEAASNISTASSEIATGNHDLSQRTEQTAANLAPIGHFAQGGGIPGRGNAGVDGFDRRQNSHLRCGHTHDLRKQNRVLHDVGFLGQGGRNVQRGVGDQQRCVAPCAGRRRWRCGRAQGGAAAEGRSPGLAHRRDGRRRGRPVHRRR